MPFEILFLNPQILYLLLAIFLLLFLSFNVKHSASNLFAPEILKQLSADNESFFSKYFYRVSFCLALSLIIIALARPVIDKGESEAKLQGLEIIVAIDISKSMDAQDFYPSRLSFALKKANDFLELMQGNKVAILAFASDAYIVSPMTSDIRIAKYLLENLDISKFQDRGSNILASLQASLDFSQQEQKLLVLFSDGGEGNLQEAKDFAKANNINIFGIATASNKAQAIKNNNGTLIKDNQGNIVLSQLNPNFKDLSQNFYRQASFSKADIKALIHNLKASYKKQAFQKKKIKNYQELFIYPLVASLLFLIFAMFCFKRTNLAILLLVLGIPQVELKALNYNFDLMQKAETLYKKGDYQKALKTYKQIKNLPTDKEANRLHNIGNTYFKSGRFNEAIKHYQQSLKIKYHADTKYNLELAKEQIKKIQQDQNKNKQKQQKNPKQNHKKKDQNQQSNKNEAAQGKNQENKKNQNQAKQEQSKSKAMNQNNKIKSKKQATSLKPVNPEAMSDAQERQLLKLLKKQKSPMQPKKVTNENQQNISKW